LLTVETTIYSNQHLDSLTEIPSEMLFVSDSGLDPHISVQAAMLQVERVAQARDFDNNQKLELRQLISNLAEAPQFLCLGEERINVLMLNLEVDKIGHE
jgi:K+-transporting ATPase ATPase C chain